MREPAPNLQPAPSKSQAEPSRIEMACAEIAASRLSPARSLFAFEVLVWYGRKSLNVLKEIVLDHDANLEDIAQSIASDICKGNPIKISARTGETSDYLLPPGYTRIQVFRSGEFHPEAP